MLHPQTELANVGPEIGLGVFAKTFIPKGTIVYIMDPLEICIGADDIRLKLDATRQVIERYSYTEPTGTRVISWDLAKYVNHSCDPNSLSTGYGFEIACRDISAGEEITDDYGLLNIEKSMACGCGSPACREQVRPDDLCRYHQIWDKKVQDALASFRSVEQPLEHMLDDLTRHQLESYLANGTGYLTVRSLYFDLEKSMLPEKQAI